MCILLKYFFASSNVNWTSVKGSLQQWDLSLMINILLNGYEWKNYVEKTFAQDVFDRSWSFDGVKTLIKKYQCKNFNFVDLAVGWALCGWPQPKHESVIYCHFLR